MARLPQPGGDKGTWGDILNEYLSQSLKGDGTLKDNIVTNSSVAPDAITATEIQDGSILEAQLASAVQTKLNAAAPTWATLSGKPSIVAAGNDMVAARMSINAPELPALRTSDIAAVQSETLPTPQRHGAKGDGIADDTAALQAFFSAGYGAGYLPPGTYRVTAGLIIPTTMKVVNMQGATIRAISAIAGPLLTYGNNTTRLDGGNIHGGILDCNNLAESGLSVPYFKGVILTDITVVNTSGHGYLIGDTAAPSAGVEMKMRGCHVERSSAGTVPSGSIGVWVRACTDSYFESSVAIGADVSWRNDGGANEFIKCHGWGWAQRFPSIIFQDTGNGNGYYACEADTPTQYGWKLDGTATQIIGGQAYYNNNEWAPDNTATAVMMTTASPNHRLIGLNVRANSASHRWARDYDSTTSGGALATATILPGATVNVVASVASIHNFPQLRVTTAPSNSDALSVRGQVGNLYFQVSTASGAPGVFFPNGWLSRWFSDNLATETARLDGSRGSLRLGTYTTSARNALTGLSVGETVYDTTLKKNVTWSGTDWRDGTGTVV